MLTHRAGHVSPDDNGILYFRGYLTRDKGPGPGANAEQQMIHRAGGPLLSLDN